MLSSVYGRRASRRSTPTRRVGSEQERVGAWHAAAAAAPAESGNGEAPLFIAAAAPAASEAAAETAAVAAPLEAERVVHGLDWEGLAAAGIVSGSGRAEPQTQEIAAIAAKLRRRAFAPDARPRDRVVLVTSANGGMSRPAVTVSLALGLSRDVAQPALLLDADPAAVGAARLLGLAPTPGLLDLLSDRALDPARQVLMTEIKLLEVLPSGPSQERWLGLLASRRMAQVMKSLLSAQPERMLLIDGPALATPEGEALALFAGQVVLVVEAGRTGRAALAEALARLGERPGIWLLLHRAPVPS